MMYGNHEYILCMYLYVFKFNLCEYCYYNSITIMSKTPTFIKLYQVVYYNMKM